jgi:prophage antirepressor-like protein
MEKRNARAVLDGTASKTCENMGEQIHPPSPTAFLPDSLGRIQETRLINEDDLLELAFVGRSKLAREFKAWLKVIVRELRTSGEAKLQKPELTEAQKILEVIGILQNQVAVQTARAEEAERTKAHISAGREAQMMGRVGGVTRALNATQTQLFQTKAALEQEVVAHGQTKAVVSQLDAELTGKEMELRKAQAALQEANVKSGKSETHLTLKQGNARFGMSFAWEELKLASTELGLKVYKVEHPDYENGVNMYPIAAFERVAQKNNPQRNLFN